MQMPFEIQLDLAAVVESPRTYYTEPSESEGEWTMFFQVFVLWQSKNALLLTPPHHIYRPSDVSAYMYQERV